MQSFDKLLTTVTNLTADVAKAADGNKSAGTRVRVALQSVKKQANEIREEILTIQKGE